MSRLGTAFAALPGGPAQQESLDFFHQSEVERLFELALSGEIPRPRELKSWEPQKLNEQHLAMVMMRAGGTRQNVIARAFNVSDATVSIVLNHPDALHLLARLQAMQSQKPSDIASRMKALCEPAVQSLEDFFEDVEIPAIKKVPHAFRVLEQNGYTKPQVQEVNVKHSLSEASAGALSQLAKAVQEASQIQEAVVVAEVPQIEAPKEILEHPATTEELEKPKWEVF